MVVVDQPDIETGETVDGFDDRSTDGRDEIAQTGEISADVRRWAEVGEAQRDELLVQGPDSFGAVDHASACFLGEVEQVRRVEVALVDRRVDAQVHEIERADADHLGTDLVEPGRLDDPAVVAPGRTQPGPEPEPMGADLKLAVGNGEFRGVAVPDVEAEVLGRDHQADGRVDVGLQAGERVGDEQDVHATSSRSGSSS